MKTILKYSLRSLLEAVLPSYTSTDSSHEVEFLAAKALEERSDRVVPGFFPDTDSMSPTPTSTPPPPPSPPPASPPPPPSPSSPSAPATVTITSISTSTSLITTTVNNTYYATDTKTVTTAIPTTLLTTTVTNHTLTTPLNQAESTHVSDASAVAHVNKSVSASEVLAIISGILNIALLIAMFFLVRRFYRMYRQERVLRKQLQTEGVELGESKHGGAEYLEREDEWGVMAKQ